YRPGIGPTVNTENDGMGLRFIEIRWPGNYCRQVITIRCRNGDHLRLCKDVLIKVIGFTITQLLYQFPLIVKQSNFKRRTYVGIGSDKVLSVGSHRYVMGVV